MCKWCARQCRPDRHHSSVRAPPRPHVRRQNPDATHREAAQRNAEKRRRNVCRRRVCRARVQGCEQEGGGRGYMRATGAKRACVNGRGLLPAAFTQKQLLSGCRAPPRQVNEQGQGDKQRTFCGPSSSISDEEVPPNTNLRPTVRRLRATGVQHASNTEGPNHRAPRRRTPDLLRLFRAHAIAPRQMM